MDNLAHNPKGKKILIINKKIDKKIKIKKEDQDFSRHETRDIQRWDGHHFLDSLSAVDEVPWVVHRSIFQAHLVSATPTLLTFPLER